MTDCKPLFSPQWTVSMGAGGVLFSLLSPFLVRQSSGREPVLFSPPVPSILFSLFSGTEIGRVHILLLIHSSL